MAARLPIYACFGIVLLWYLYHLITDLTRAIGSGHSEVSRFTMVILCTKVWVLYTSLGDDVVAMYKMISSTYESTDAYIES